MDKYTGPQREKYWNELTDQEKIERLREVLKRRTDTICNLEFRLTQLERLFRNHSHSPIGHAVTPVPDDNFYRSIPQNCPTLGNPDEQYI